MTTAEQIAAIVSAANSIGVLVLTRLHFKNAAQIAQNGVKLVSDAFAAVEGGRSAEIAAAPQLLQDAAALAASITQPEAPGSVTATALSVTKTK